ncbi:uncharacterized protein LOC114528393 [Dendronephthya gigantea]|uniref:uncharacterized protein LOC114528393 n=1 Tax=Dendronephthya gigantea TaxID=151771 RepID=UPI00106D298E|nr:uncharacterized protein LOC114528393 [Dendronephthya gigantea]
MHVFGTTCYAFLQNTKKIDAKSRKGIFIGYDRGSPSYLIYYPELDKIEKVRCVKFIDNFQGKDNKLNDLDEFVPDRKPSSTSNENPKMPSTVEESSNNLETISENVTNNTEVVAEGDRYPTRVRNKPNYFDQSKLDDTLDPCVYVRTIDDERCVIVIVWVDDIIIASSDSNSLQSVKKSLKERFKMTDLGILKWFLGTEFQCSENTIKMNQTRYIEKILEKFKMTDCKPKPTPCELG